MMTINVLNKVKKPSKVNAKPMSNGLYVKTTKTFKIKYAEIDLTGFYVEIDRKRIANDQVFFNGDFKHYKCFSLVGVVGVNSRSLFSAWEIFRATGYKSAILDFKKGDSKEFHNTMQGTFKVIRRK